MNPNTNSEDQSSWSDDLGFLTTIAWLINKAHEASMNDGDVYDWFWILEQLQIEIEGQLFFKEKKESITKLDELREEVSKTLANAYNKIGDNVVNKQNITKLRHIVLPYHRLLNRIIHAEQLRLRNFDTVHQPSWSKK